MTLQEIYNLLDLQYLTDDIFTYTKDSFDSESIDTKKFVIKTHINNQLSNIALTIGEHHNNRDIVNTQVDLCRDYKNALFCILLDDTYINTYHTTK